jgi:hypothetical protein
MGKGAMLEAGFMIVRFYKDVATSLAQSHRIPYPDLLEKLMVKRLEDLRDEI